MKKQVFFYHKTVSHLNIAQSTAKYFNQFNIRLVVLHCECFLTKHIQINNKLTCEHITNMFIQNLFFVCNWFNIDSFRENTKLQSVRCIPKNLATLNFSIKYSYVSSTFLLSYSIQILSTLLFDCSSQADSFWTTLGSIGVHAPSTIFCCQRGSPNFFGGQQGSTKPKRFRSTALWYESGSTTWMIDTCSNYECSTLLV